MLSVSSFLGGSFSGSTRLKDARTSAEGARSHVRNAYLTLDQSWEILLSEVIVLQGRLDSDDGYVLQLEEYRQRAADALQLATSAYVRIEADVEPELDSVPVARAVYDAWARVGNIMDQATERLALLQQVVAGADRAETASTALLEQLDGRLESARQAVDDARSIGFGVDNLVESLDTAEREMMVARRAFESARLWQAAGMLERIDLAIRDVLDSARGLGTRRAELLRRHLELTESAQGAPQVVSQIRKGARAVSERFGRSVWDGIADAPEGAASLIPLMHAGLELARGALSMEVQNFSRAEQNLNGVATHLENLDHMLSNVHTLQRDLTQATSAYPQLHAEAVSSLRSAQQFVRQHAHEINPAHQPRLQRAASILSQTESQAAAGRADPFAACARLREVDSASDAVLFQARNDRQRTQAHRTHVARKIQDAHWVANRATASSGMGLLGWSRDAKVRLNGVRQMLAEAERLLSSDPVRADELVSQANTMAHEIVGESRGFNR